MSAIRLGEEALLARVQDAGLGLHVLDVNLALGDLVEIVRVQAAAYSAR